MINFHHTISKFSRDSKSIVTMGFVVLLVLMILLAAIGLSSMNANDHRLQRVVNEQNAKLELIASMRNIARERVLSLFMALNVADPFEQDAAFVKFDELASEFIEARDQLQAMHLDQDEKINLIETLKAVKAASGSQAQVVDMIKNGEIAQAQSFLVEHTIPSQLQVINSYNDLLKLQKKIAVNTIAEANQANHTTYLLMFFLVGAALSMGFMITVVVVRRIAHVENALYEEKELAEVTLHSIADGVITTNRNGLITYINPVAEDLTGWDLGHAINQPLSRVYNIISEKTGSMINHANLFGVLDGPTASAEDRLLIRRDGHQFAIEDSAAPIRNRDGELIGNVLVFNDVTESHNLHQQLSWQASHDSLTGLVNRREFESKLRYTMDLQKNLERMHVLLFLDLDKFKLINDTSGHKAGDEFLRQLSRMLEIKIRSSDTLARLGGDEFAILLDSCSLERALEIAESIRQLVASFKFSWEDKVFEIGVSIGVIPLDGQISSTADAIAAADAACLKAKHEGRNQVHVFQGQEAISSRRGEMQWVQKINQALEEDLFRLYFQRITPTVDQGNERAHYEILLRLDNEDGKVISPAAFIPIAERYGLMLNIDRWVISHMLAWLQSHPQTLGMNAVYSLNLSGHSLGDNRFLEFVVNLLTQAGLAPGTISFEITETVAIANLSKAVRFISTLKELGCLFSLDDFGSGMSSYGYLKNLNVDFLKIDGAFVKNMVHDPVDCAMVESINRIGHVMGIKTVAEFVESDEIYQELISLGVDYAQGYALHKPEPLPA